MSFQPFWMHGSIGDEPLLDDIMVDHEVPYVLIFVFKGRPLFGVEAHREVDQFPEEQVVIIHLQQRYEHTS